MKAYSFLDTFVNVNLVPLSGWADGDDVIKITRRADAATDKMGADGKMALALNADRSGEITIKLMQTSPSNAYLNGLANLQAAGPKRFVPVVITFQDSYRQDMGAGALGYIKKLPDVSRGAGIATQEWTFVVERLDLILGAPAFVGFATALAETA